MLIIWCFVQQLSESLTLEANGSGCRDALPDIMQRDSLNLRSALSTFPLVLRESHGKGYGKIVGVREDGEHKKNMVH